MRLKGTISYFYVCSLFALIFFSSAFISHCSSYNGVNQNSNPMHINNNFAEISQDNASVIFEFYLNKTEIVRGKDDLVFNYRFAFENGSLIPSATLYYNITNPAKDLVCENSFNITSPETNSVNIPWYTFNSQPEGNYTIFVIANSTFTGAYVANKSFELIVLQTGLIRMIFTPNPAFLKRNQTNNVYFEMANVGATTVTNISLSLAVEITGTEGFLYIFTPPIIDVTLKSGESYHNNLTLIPDTYLYKRVKFSIVYYTIDDPSTPKFSISDTLEIIVLPNISITPPIVPANITMGKTLLLSFNITNYEDDLIYIAVHAECPLISFEDFSVKGPIVVSPQWHQFTIEGTPLEPGSTAIFFWIDIEWRMGEQVLHYSTILDTIIYEITVLVKHIPTKVYDPTISYSIILSTFILALAYFSRDFVKNIIHYARKDRIHTIPEVKYPLPTVILDGSNIAWEEKDLEGRPKISNIEAMINKLSQANFTKIITVADAALRYQIDDVKRLDFLVKEGAIKMLPARVDGDKFILRLAEEENAMIVSNDLFKEYRDIAPWIEERRIPYTILNGEVYLHPTSVRSVKDYEQIKQEEKKIEKERIEREQKKHKTENKKNNSNNQNF